MTAELRIVYQTVILFKCMITAYFEGLTYTVLVRW